MNAAIFLPIFTIFLTGNAALEPENYSVTSLSNDKGGFWEPPLELSDTELSRSRERTGRTWWYSNGFPWTIGLVRIENAICTGTNNLQGMCYTIKQCARVSGGIPAGLCARNYGRCCVTLNSCGSTSNINNTYFQSPGFPAAYTGGTRCSMTIQQCDASICQLRISFVRLSLAPPVGGVCSNDVLTITGGADGPIKICGENDGQHVYVNFNSADNIILTIDTSTAFPFNRYWQIQIAQIPCESETRAPPGCLQYYYDGTAGTVNSFNFGTALVDPITTSRQIRNQNYAVCILQTPGYCSITWTSNSFYISETGGVVNLAQTGPTCTDNYVIIPTGSAGAIDRFCGSSFGGPITANAKPFALYYVTSAAVGGGTLGFSLNYALNQCDNSLIL